MHNKKLVLVLVITILISNLIIVPVFGENDSQTQLDVTEIQQAIIDNNLELKKLDQDIDLNQKKYDKAVDEKDTLEDDVIENNLRLKEYYVQEAQMNIDYAQWTKSEKQKDLLLQGEEDYWRLLLLNEEIALENNKISRLKNELSQIQKKVDLGQDVSSSITTASINIQNEESVLRGLQQQKEEKEMDLNLLIRQGIATEIVLKNQEVPDIDYTKDIEEAIAQATDKSGEISKVKSEIALDELKGGIYEKYGYTKAHQDAELDIKNDKSIKELDLQGEITNVEYNLRSQYNTILNDKDGVEIAKLTLDNLNIDLNAASKRLEVGLTTRDAVEQLKEQVSFGELDLKKAKLDYYIAVQKLKSLI